MKQLQTILVLFIPTSFFFSCKEPDSNTAASHKITLGHCLFYEKKLSFNQSKSCASCHSPEYAFTDGYRRSVSAIGENLLHNAPCILNISQNFFFDWDNPDIMSLDKQIKRPLYNAHPVEMGFVENNPALYSFFENDSTYRSLFLSAYGHGNDPYTASHVEECIVAYVKSLNSQNSAYDKYINGDVSALNQHELNGMLLFNSEKLRCNNCHRPPTFTISTLTKNTDSVYINIGLYNINNESSYPPEDKGLMKHTHKESDNGKFRVPSLRNVMATAPYMHDGSVGTIQEVIDIYARGGRNIHTGEYQGDGALNRHKHSFIQGFTISAEEKNDLISFLSALTDTSYLSNPQFTDPFHNK